MNTTELLALIDRMRRTLLDAVEERPKRRDAIEVPGGTRPELGWVIFERETMLAAVNAERTERGLAPAQMRDVAAAESVALGHSDYVSKYALGCAELVVKAG